MKSKIPTDPQSDALRILILEDVPTDAELVKRELRKAGFKFTARWINNKNDFLSQLEEFSPDIVLSDYSMPQFNGMEALVLVKERFPSTPLIIVTGAMNEETAVECMKAGAADYVIKENMARLGQAVVKVLKNKRTREEKGRAEEALREIEQRFRSLVETTSDWVWEVDENGVYTYVSPKSKELLGYEPDQVVGKTLFDLMPPEEAERVYRLFMTLSESMESFKDLENTNLHKDGRLVVLETDGMPIFDADGSFKGYRGIDRNITERKRADAILRARENQIRLLLNSTAEAICGLDREGKSTFVNRACLRLLGHSTNDELIGKNIHHLIHHAYPGGSPYPVEECPIFQAFRKGEYIHIDDEVLWRKDGTSFSAEYWSYPIVQNDQILGAVVTFIDITERKRTEEALKKSEKKYRTLFEDYRDAIYIVTRDGEFVDVNQAMVELFGYKKEEMMGINMIELYRNPDEGPRILGELEKKGSLKDYEIKFKKKEGKEIDCLITVTAKKGDDGSIIGYQGMIRDITKQKKLEAQFLQAQKMEAIGRLAGGIAHDFNNLLTAIIGNAELSLAQLGKDSSLREMIVEINNAGQRAASLTRQLLAFSRKQVIQPKVLNLNEILEDMEKMLRRMIGEDVELKTVLEPNLWRVEADPGQMEQVIMNLAVNARDAMSQGGRLTLETANVNLDDDYFRDRGVAEDPDPYVMLAVSDSGIGMDEEIRSHLFEPFFTTKEKGKGTGLGLSTVYGIVKQSGGYIWPYSEPGQGTTFKVYFPSVAGEISLVQKKKISSINLKGSETILVVEDNKPVLKMTRKILKTYGYNVLAAQDGDEAVSVSEQYEQPIHLMLTDVIMPKMSGCEVAKQMEHVRPGMKVLYMSGYTDNAVVHHGILEKDRLYIQKPFTLEDLVFKVREVLDS